MVASNTLPCRKLNVLAGTRGSWTAAKLSHIDVLVSLRGEIRASYWTFPVELLSTQVKYKCHRSGRASRAVRGMVGPGRNAVGALDLPGRFLSTMKGAGWRMNGLQPAPSH